MSRLVARAADTNTTCEEGDDNSPPVGEVAGRDATAELGDGVAVLTPQRSVRPLRPDGGGGDREYVARALRLDDEAAMVVSARENGGVGTSRESVVWSRDAGPGVGFVRLVSGVLADATG